MNDLGKNLFLWGVIAIVLLLAVRSFGPDVMGSTPTSEVSYSEFMKAVDDGQVSKATIEEDGRKI